MALSFPSSTGVFIPSHKASGGLMTGYSRNPKDFAINRVAQVIQVDKPIGYYATWNSRQAARVRYNATHAPLSDFAWKDGQAAPSGADNLESFAFVKFECNRYSFPFTIGDMMVKAADWNILQAHADVVAQQAMTGRSLLAYYTWSNVNQWGDHVAIVDGGATGVQGTGAAATSTGHVTTLTNGTGYDNSPLLASGQNCGNGTANSPNFKKVLNRVRRKIELDTLATVGVKDLRIVMNPNTAMKISEAQEVHQYLANSYWARDQIRGGEPGLNDVYGLPDHYNGFELVVDNTVLDNSQKPADSVDYLIPDGEALVCTRKGGLEGIGGGPAHSTLVIFYYQDDMTVESFHSVNDRLTQGRLVTNFTVVITSYYSGFYLKNMLG